MRHMLAIDDDLRQAIEARMREEGDDRWSKAARRVLRRVFISGESHSRSSSNKSKNRALKKGTVMSAVEPAASTSVASPPSEASQGKPSADVSVL